MSLIWAHLLCYILFLLVISWWLVFSSCCVSSVIHPLSVFWSKSLLKYTMICAMNELRLNTAGILVRHWHKEASTKKSWFIFVENSSMPCSNNNGDLFLLFKYQHVTFLSYQYWTQLKFGNKFHYLNFKLSLATCFF